MILKVYPTFIAGGLLKIYTALPNVEQKENGAMIVGQNQIYGYRQQSIWR